jgi:5-(carboxyamino)imidazole ribonucleotide synthase
VSALPLLPGSTIGIVGGGQLGRMLGLEARRMGYRTVVLEPDPRAPATPVCDEQIVAPLSDVEAARELAARSDVVTLEWENADVAAVAALAEIVPVRPGPHVLRIAQNRLLEKETARALGLETADFRAVRDLADLKQALRELGTPAILKTATGGYDGRGQFLLRNPDEAEEAFAATGAGQVDLILEARVDFRLEASVLCARGQDGSIVSFPVGENIHRKGILDVTFVPAGLPPSVAERAIAIGERFAAGLDLIGLLAVELFVDREDRVLVNEIAPRPHNSGHYTWEACSVSQFEQQIRAVCGLPLEKPRLLSPAAMANLLGEDIGTGEGLATVVEALRTPGLRLHLYGKAEPRTGRKMGHLTVLAEDAHSARRAAESAREILRRGHVPMDPRAEPTDTSNGHHGSAGTRPTARGTA